MTNRERAETLAKSWWETGRKGGRRDFVADIKSAIDETCAELVDEIATMVGQEPAINALAFEKMIRDNFGAK